MQVVQVHLQPFRRNSLLKYVSQPEIAKNVTKDPYLGGSRSSTLTPIKSLLLLHVCAYLQPFSCCTR